jgi:glycosyltransferase involved in cell wall biosynthesis
MDNVKKIDLSIVLPCLNEEKAINSCLDEIRNTINKSSFLIEIIIVDNNSTDQSTQIIKKYIENNPSIDIKLLEEKIPGYGSAYQRGFSIAKGDLIFMADLDGTYKFTDIPKFIKKIKEGNDIVIGNRFGDIEKKEKLGSMPWHHQYIGNPFLSMLVRRFFKIKIKDIHCGARMIKRESLEKLSLTTRGMEFASEMIIKASLNKLKMAEIPITYDERIGESKLNSFRDGWRHLRFIFLYSPILLFLIPGLFLFFIGILSMIILYLNTPSFFNLTFYIHPMFISSGCIITGYQLIYFAFFTKTYAINHIGEKNSFFEKLFKFINLKRASILGILLLFSGILIYSNILYKWVNSDFGQLDQIKNSIVALTLLIIGIQTISSAFMLSIISIKQK